ncbi:hypothetical protein C2U70_11130 [Bradyrhizobium guangdongense]|nr:hypothetical protein C2U70_11130 [Bradyrhizobium guangdongense]
MRKAPERSGALSFADYFLMPQVLVFLHWLPRPPSIVQGLQNFGRLLPAVTQFGLPGRQLAEAVSTANDRTVNASRVAERIRVIAVSLGWVPLARIDSR